MGSRSGKKHSRRGRQRSLPIVGLVALIVVVVGGIWLVVSAAGNHKSEVSVTEAAALREEGALFLDVRTPEEWAEIHVPGSVLIPLDELEQRVSEVPHDREVVVICGSGVRSKSGRDILASAGFRKVSCMTGGISEWRANGYPTVTGP